MAGNKSEKNAPKNQEMQEITIEGELRTDGPKYLPPYYSWKHVHGEKEQIEVWVYWKGPMSTLLQRNDLKSTVDVFNPKSEKIKFNFKVGNDILGYAIYDYFSNKWQEGHISKILDVDNYMISVADKMKKIIDLLGKNNTRYVPEYELNGNVWELVKGTRELITEKNKELTELKAGIPLIFLEHGSISYKDIDTRADETIKFLNSEYYKDCTKNKKNVGAFKRFKRNVKKVFNKVTSREKVEDLYHDIANGLSNLCNCTFLDYESTTENGELENKKLIELINNLKNEVYKQIDPTNIGFSDLLDINSKLCKIVKLLLEKDYGSQLRSVYINGYNRVTISDANIKMILKQYGISNPDDTLKEAAICRYVLEILPTLKRSPESKIDEETMNKENLKEVLEKYKKVIKKFEADTVGESAGGVPKDKVNLPSKKSVPSNTETLKQNCEGLAQYYGLKGFEKFCDADLLKNLNKRYGELPSYFSDMPGIFKEKLSKIREDTKRIAYVDYVLTELLKNKIKEGISVKDKEEFEIVSEPYSSSSEDEKIIAELDKLKQQRSVLRYLDGLGAIGANYKKWKKWNGYLKDKIKDLKSVIKEYCSKYSLDDRYLKEAEFISILYILSRSVERAGEKRSLAEYLKEFGYRLFGGFNIPESIGDSEAVKYAANELYKACKECRFLFRCTMDKKQCIKILNCIGTNRYEDIDPETRKNLKILEKKIKSKLKAN